MTEGQNSSPPSDGMDRKHSLPLPGTAAAAIILVGLWGCLSIYSSKAYTVLPFYFVQRQFLWLLCGAVVFLIAALIPFRLYCAWSKRLFLFVLASFLLVLFFGREINGMRGWFTVMPGVNLQPGEFGKGMYLLFLATISVRTYSNEFQRFLFLLSAASAAAFLLILEPDFGTASLYIASFLVVYWISGGRIGWLAAALGLALMASAFFVYLHPYAWDRLMAFLQPESEITRSSWHIRQFQLALAQGGIGGSESGGALWSNAYLPLPHTDSLFASIVETSGLIGGGIVIGGFLLLAFWTRSIAIRKNMSDRARVFFFSAGFLYVMQAFLHISVNVVLVPPTGVTLPILSYGGSSLLSTMLVLGMMLSSIHDRNDPEPQECLSKNEKSGQNS